MDNKAADKTLGHSVQAASVLALTGTGDAFLYAYLPSNYKTLGLSIFWVGLLLSINRFTRLFLNGWVAYHLSTKGVRSVTMIASVIAMMTTVLYGFANSIGIWILARILWGITFSTLRLGSIIYALQHPKQGISLGISKAIIESGTVIALLLGSVLIFRYDRSLTFLLFGAFSFIGFILAIFLPKLEIMPVRKKDLILSSPSTFNVMVLMNAFVVEGMLVILLSSLLLRDFTVSPLNILFITGFCLAYRRACLIVVSPLAGWMADKWGFEKLFNYTGLLLIAGIVLIAAGFIIPGLIVSFTFSAMNSAVAPGGAITKTGSWLKEVSDNATWRDIGAACGTLIGALCLDIRNINTIFILASIGLTGGIIIHFIKTKKKTVYNGIS